MTTSLIASRPGCGGLSLEVPIDFHCVRVRKDVIIHEIGRKKRALSLSFVRAI